MLFRIVFVLFLGCAMPARAQEDTILDYPKETPGIVLHSPEKKKQVAEYRTLPDGSAALKVSWVNGLAGHFEFVSGNRRLPGFDAAEIRVRAYIPDGCSAKRLAIRLTDRDGEIFQFSRPVEAGKEGWRDFVYAVDPESPEAESWYGGKKANKKLDFPVAFSGIAAPFGGPKGREEYLGIGQVFFRMVSAAPLVALETGQASAVHVLAPGEGERLGLRVRNRRPAAMPYEVEYRVGDIFETLLAEKSLRFELAAGEDKFLPLPRPGRFGVYPVQVTFREGDAEPVKRRMSYCHMEPAGRPPETVDGFHFGVCAHLQRPLQQGDAEAMRHDVLAAALCGVDSVRFDASWGRIEPKPGQYTFALYDPVVEELERYGIRWMALLNYPPSWAFAKDWKEHAIGNRGVPAIDMERFAEFARTFLRHYGDKVRYVEFLNEPDHPGFGNFTPEKYLEMLAAAYAAVKAEKPDVTVMSGGLAGIVDDKQQNLARMIWQSGQFDWFAFHGHGSLGGYRPQVARLLQYRKEFQPGKPWYANETAISAIRIGELRQAETLFQKVIYSMAREALGFNWYDLRNDGPDPDANEHNFGLVTRDFHPKAGYVAYNALIKRYRGARFHGDLPLGEGVDGYLFKAKNGDWLLANWSNRPGGSEVPVLLSGVTGKASRIDLFGNETPCAGKGGLLVVESGRMPSTLRISGQEGPPAVQGFVFRQTGDLSVAREETREFAFELANPTAKPLVFRLSATPPSRLTAKAPVSRVTVAPGGKTPWKVSLRAEPGFLSPPSASKELAIDLAIGDLWRGVLRSQVRNVISVPLGDFRKTPDFLLDDPAQVITFVTNAPDMEPHFWKGTDDLGARVWLGRTQDALLVRTEVTDNIHHQPRGGADAWKADGIQLALHLPGQPFLWEIGLNRLDNGESDVHVWLAPDGFQPADAAREIRLTTARDEKAKTTRYDAEIPRSAIGLTEAAAKRGFRFNLLVNDNDGEMRKNAIGITPGIAEEKSSERYVLVDFR